MKAVMPHVPEQVLRRRKQTGADRWDEIWEGVLYMAPAPNREQQDLEATLEMWLRIHWAQPRGNRVYHQINVAAPGGWPDEDYRIPDLVLQSPDDEGWLVSAATGVLLRGKPAGKLNIQLAGDPATRKLLPD